MDECDIGGSEVLFCRTNRVRHLMTYDEVFTLPTVGNRKGKGYHAWNATGVIRNTMYITSIEVGHMVDWCSQQSGRDYKTATCHV